MVNRARPFIAIVVRRLWTAGAQRIAIEEARFFKRLGYDARLLFLLGPKDGSDYSVLLKDIDWEIVCDSEGNVPGSRLSAALTRVVSPIPSPDARVDLYSLLQGVMRIFSLRPDIVICHDPYASLVGSIARFLHRIPYIVYVHEAMAPDIAYSSRIQRMMRWVVEYPALRNATAIFTNTRATRDSVLHMLPGRKDVEVAYPGVSQCSEPFSPPRGPPVILSVSTWEEGRFPRLYCDVARHLRSGRVVLAGMWKDNVALQRYSLLAETPDFRGRVEITGPLSEGDLDREYHRASVFIRFGHQEHGVGMGVLEAMNHGVPVVINSGLGARELVSSEVGIVLEEPSASQVAAAVDSILSDKVGLGRMARSAHDLATSLSWENHVRILEKAVRAQGITIELPTV